jgi:hypothetical protein
MKMINRTELYELAKVGMRERLKVVEAQLSGWYREFPDVFLGPPQLLRPELRNGHSPNGLGPVITTLPREHPESKVARALPYLIANGPTRLTALATALGLKSPGSLSSFIARHLAAGTITKVGKGEYAATAAGMAAAAGSKRTATPTKKKKKTKTTGGADQVRKNRKLSAQLLDVVAQDGPLTADVLKARGHNVQQYVGPLVRRGYLVKGRNGSYKRTPKAFVVDTRKSAGA